MSTWLTVFSFVLGLIGHRLLDKHRFVKPGSEFAFHDLFEDVSRLARIFRVGFNQLLGKGLFFLDNVRGNIRCADILRIGERDDMGTDVAQGIAASAVSLPST